MIKILNSENVAREEIFSRVVPTVNVEDIVADIIKNVRERGDAALYEYCEKFDGAKLSSLEVTEEEIAEEQKNGDFSKGYCESICTYRHICEKLADYGVFLMHSSVLEAMWGVSRIFSCRRSGSSISGGSLF